MSARQQEEREPLWVGTVEHEGDPTEEPLFVAAYEGSIELRYRWEDDDCRSIILGLDETRQLIEHLQKALRRADFDPGVGA